MIGTWLRTKKRKLFFTPHLINSWNSLPQEVPKWFNKFTKDQCRAFTISDIARNRTAMLTEKYTSNESMLKLEIKPRLTTDLISEDCLTLGQCAYHAKLLSCSVANEMACLLTTPSPIDGSS